MVEMDYLDAFQSTVRRYPDKVALATLDGRTVTYNELDSRTDSLATALDDRLDNGRCAVLSENRIAAVESMIAAMKRGKANIQLFTRSSVGELADMMAVSQAKGLLFDSASVEKAAGLIEEFDLSGVLCVGDRKDEIKNAEKYEEVLSTTSLLNSTKTRDSSESAVFFTSGTTGTPKGVLVDQNRSWLAAHQPALEMGLQARDRALVCTPWYHQVTSNTWILGHLLVGATLVLQPNFEPAETLQAIESHEITGLLAVPTQLETLLEIQNEMKSRVDTLSYIRTGGAIVPEQLIRSVRAEFTENVFNTYGLTEGIVNLTFAYPEEQLDHPGTIGKASFFWELRVVDATESDTKPDPDKIVDPGEKGEILGKGPGMSEGYLDGTEQTDDVFVDGWLRTGDIAYVDEDGYLVITGRVDNMINSGGENIYPQEVERALTDHPKVHEAGVVGIPDEKWGQSVSAMVVVDDDLTESELDRHCKEHNSLPNFKRPREYILLSDEESLPQSASGTLKRKKIKDRFDG